MVGLCLLLFAVFTGELQAQTYVMGQQQSVTTCGGLFVDSGGAGGSYGPNEDFELTFCPDGSGQNVQLLFANVNVQEGDLLCFYDGPDTNAPILTCSNAMAYGNSIIIQGTAANPSGCVTVTFTSDGSGEDSGWAASIDCVQDCQIVYSDLVVSEPERVPADTGYIDICPGDRVTFTGAGIYPQSGTFYDQSDQTSSFVWNFGDGMEAVGPSVSHVYENPGGYTVQLSITDAEGCTNTNFISQRVRVSTYPDYNLGEAAEAVCAGDTISFTGAVDTIMPEADISVMGVEGSFQQGGVRSDTLLLPDGAGGSYSTSISFSQFAPGATLSDANDLLSVCLSLEHSYGGDLDIEIICPNGQSAYILSYPSGVGSTNFGEPFASSPVDQLSSDLTAGIPYEYCFSMTDTDYGTLRNEALAYQYTYTTVPGTTGNIYTYTDSYFPEGSYLPQQSFDNLLGCPLNGDWTIRVQDNLALDNGWLFSWGINFAAHLFPRLETFQPNITDWGWRDSPSAISVGQDSVVATPMNAGLAAYTFFVSNDFGCTFDTTLNIPVLPLTHPDCYNCDNSLTASEDTAICEGETVSLNAEFSSPDDQAVTFEAVPQRPFGAGNHPPANAYESIISVNSINPPSLFNPFTQIESVCVNIETNWNSDIDLFLIAPNGTMLELSTGNGGGSDNYTNTCFTPTAVTPITMGTGPFTGDFRPEGDWVVLQDAAINGDWILRASDRFGPNDIGEFTSWSITFNTTNQIDILWQGAGLSCTDCEAPEVTPGSTASYIVQAEDSYGCQAADTVLVEVVSDIGAPEVSCVPIEEGIAFNWTSVGGFQNYEVRQLLNGIPGPWQGPISGNSFFVDGLANGDEVTLEVRVFISGTPLNCEIAIGSASCTYDFCNLILTADSLSRPSCYGFADGFADLVQSGGTAPLTYSLNGGPEQDSPSFTDLAAGDYTAVVTDSEGCTDTLLFGLSEPDTLSLSLQLVTPVSCFGNEEAVISSSVSGGNGGFVYNWSTGLTGDEPQASGLPSGTYSLSITDSRGCEAEASLSFGQPDSLSISFTAENASCASTANGSLQAFVSGGTSPYTYDWSNGAATPSLANLPAGEYCLTVIDANGCAQTRCVALSSPPALLIDSVATSAVLCNGEATGTASVFPSGGTLPYSYQWDDALSQSGATANMLSAQTYNVQVTDANGCGVMQQLMISEPPPLSLDFEVQAVNCKDGSDGRVTALPSGGIEPYDYSWSDNQNSPVATGLSAGSLQLSLTDANGCVLEASVEVEEPEEAVSLAVEQTFRGCNGQQDNEAQALGSGGTGSYTYAWSTGQTASIASGLDSLAYTVTATDGNGCTATASIKPVDLPAITFLIIANPPSCNNIKDGRLGINQISGGIGQVFEDYTITWSTGVNGPVTADLAGGQTYSVTVTDGQGCSMVRERSLPEPEPVMLTLSTDSVRCAGNSDGQVAAVDIISTAAPFRFEWSNGDTTQVIDSLTAGTYSLTVTDQNGCIGEASTTVLEPPALQATLMVVDNDCFGQAQGSIQATPAGGTPGYTFAWSTGQTAALATGLGAAGYDLSLTDANGCETVVEANVEEPEPLMLTLDPTMPSCAGDMDGRINAQAEGGTAPYRYSLDNSTFLGTGQLIALAAGDYQVFVRDAKGCTASELAKLSDPPVFRVDAGPDSRNIVLGDSILLQATAENANGQVDFTWMAPYAGTLSCEKCSTATAQPEYSILYTLIGVDELGCRSTDEVRIYVDKPRIVEVPTGFTPNGDGTNDRLIVHGQAGTMIESFRVFDRWGELVYEAQDFPVNDEAAGWDGAFRGKELMPGVYVWHVIAIFSDGREESRSGQTNLIR